MLGLRTIKRHPAGLAMLFVCLPSYFSHLLIVNETQQMQYQDRFEPPIKRSSKMSILYVY